MSEVGPDSPDPLLQRHHQAAALSGCRQSVKTCGHEGAFASRCPPCSLPRGPGEQDTVMSGDDDCDPLQHAVLCSCTRRTNIYSSLKNIQTVRRQKPALCSRAWPRGGQRGPHLGVGQKGGRQQNAWVSAVLRRLKVRGTELSITIVLGALVSPGPGRVSRAAPWKGDGSSPRSPPGARGVRQPVLMGFGGGTWIPTELFQP